MDTTIKKILPIVLILFSISLASAQIIGGEIFFENNMEPSWQTVFVYDSIDQNKYFESTVSPDKFRYSFLNSDLGGANIFQKDLTIIAEILDFENGLAAGPVEMKLTEDEYQIFSKMEFREVIQIKEPRQNLIISPEKKFTLEMNVYDDCNTYLNENQLCEYGCDYKENQEASFGQNNLQLITDCFTGDRLKGSSREMVLPENKTVVYQKEITTVDEENSIFKINFHGTKSQEEFSITDFIPKEFEVFNISSNGIAFEEDGYYSIEWKKVKEESFDFEYFIKPKEKINSCEFGIVNQNLEKLLLRKSFEKTSQNLNQHDIKNQKFYFNCNFSTKLNFQLIESADLKKEFQNKIQKGSEGKIKLNLQTSSEISQIEFKEYVPKEFEISKISNNGKLSSSTANYNVITWNLTGQTFDLEYTVNPTVTGDFNTISELDKNLLEESWVNVYRLVPPIISPNPSKGGSVSGSSGSLSPTKIPTTKPYKYEPENFSKITKSNPIIRKKENVLVAFYSNIFDDKAAFDLFQFIYEGDFNKTLDYIKSYSIQTNMKNQERNKTYFEYEVNKSFLDENNYKDIKFYTKEKNKLIPITGGVISESGNSIKYAFESPTPISEFHIFAEKGIVSFKQKIINFFKRILNKFF